MLDNAIDSEKLCRLDPEQVYGYLGTAPPGLSAQEAQTRLNQYGKNAIPRASNLNPLKQLLMQFTHFLALTLWVAGFLALAAGMPQLAYATWAVIIVNALFSFFQEYRADKALARLSEMLPSRVKVYRSGELLIVPAEDITVGDLIVIEAGDSVPADARIVETSKLYLDNSLLTGESVPVDRNDLAFELGGRNITESGNLVFGGTTVTEGKGTAVVYAVGSQSEIGQVSRLTQSIKRGDSTLEVQVQGIVKFITRVALFLGLVAFAVAVWVGGLSPKVGFIFAIGIIVANIPEGLLPTVSLSLAVSVQHMAKQNALVRRLSAVENLCAASVICTDKTGTITENQLTVKKIWTLDGQADVEGLGYEKAGGVVYEHHHPAQLEMLLKAAVVCSEADIISEVARPELWKAVGPPTEAALLIAAEKYGIRVDEVRNKFPWVDVIPFSSEIKRMSVYIKNPDDSGFPGEGYLVFSKGAPLEILSKCAYVFKNGVLSDLTAEKQQTIIEENDRLASEGYRILGFSYKTDRSGQFQAEEEMVFLGLTAMVDPPRPEVYEAVRQCANAGIKVTIITGDYGLTAASIAKQIGLIVDEHQIVNEHEFSAMNEEELEALLRRDEPIIFSRATPEHKLRIVEAYKRLGEIVAVTGDGVNDTLALKASHIGIAMGVGGTDVAREVADMVLLDNNFATIIKAIEQGRAVYSNIRKFLIYIMTSNVAEFAPFITMPLLKIPPALNILQILAIDLGTDIVPALALGAEKPEPGLLSQPPGSFQKSLLNKSLFIRSYCYLGLMESILAIGMFVLIWQRAGYGLAELQSLTNAILNNSAPAAVQAMYEYATTMALAAIIACQIGNLFICRSETLPIWKLLANKNSLIYIGLVFEVLLSSAIIFLPVLESVFKTRPITINDLLLLLVCPLAMIMIDEVRKALNRLRTNPSM
ncbi:MAG: cation-transporting P-type ATPase [Syntrophomonadaceae bacterium]